jgi:hypothetical protein
MLGTSSLSGILGEGRFNYVKFAVRVEVCGCALLMHGGVLGDDDTATVVAFGQIADTQTDNKSDWLS